MLRVGDNGYRKMATDVATTMQRIQHAVEEIPELECLVQPDCAVVPITSQVCLSTRHSP